MAAPQSVRTGNTLWSLLQISDQFFPTGAYTFSHALETYVTKGIIDDRVSCQQWLVNLSYNTLGPCDMLFCRQAHRLSAAQNLTKLVHLDRRLTAIKTARELRHESQHTGRAFLRAAMALSPPPFTKAVYHQLQQDMTGHHAIAFGTVAQGLGASENDTMQAFLYTITAGWVAAATRLIPLGQTDAQHLLHSLADTLLDVMQLYQGLSIDDAWSFTPGLDIRSMQHERLYSRLCRS
ncbi:MAG: urease accessory protein UreF [bacterium]|nr:urease accessory protein UreF [bacterium]